MTKRVIEHEIKLEKSVKFILAALAFGVLAHALVPAFSVKSAIADIATGPLAVRLNSPLKKALLTGFHSTAKHIAAKAVSPSSETMRTI